MKNLRDSSTDLNNWAMLVKQLEYMDDELQTVTIKVALDEDMFKQIGRDIYFDLVDFSDIGTFRAHKHLPFYIFKEEVAKQFKVPVQLQRFWLWAERMNQTFRPNRPLTDEEEIRSVGQLRHLSNKGQNGELKLFLEVQRGPDLHPRPLPDRTKEDILLFFKLYDPEKEIVRYLGRLFAKSRSKPLDIVRQLNEMAGLDPNEEIELYEEINFKPSVMFELIDKRVTFCANRLEDGDIICIHKPLLVERQTQCRYPDAPSFLEYVVNRQIICFRTLEKPEEDDFYLELSKTLTYDDVTERVARRLGLEDSSKIRLTPHSSYSQGPKPQAIKYQGVDHLTDMWGHNGETYYILYYEILDIPLTPILDIPLLEVQELKSLKVSFHHAITNEVLIYNIRIPNQNTVADLIKYLKTKVQLSHPNAELRLLQVFYHKIYKIFPLHEMVENLNDRYTTLRAEEISEEEKKLGPHDRLIYVYHFMKDESRKHMTVQNFGEPFVLMIHESETLAKVKLRIQMKLQVSDADFSMWKFAFVSLGRPEYLQDFVILSSRFQKTDVYGAWEHYLGLEHSKSSPISYAVSQPIQVKEKNHPFRGPQPSKFTWKIENFSGSNMNKHYSDMFMGGGRKWWLVVYPKGDNVNHLSLYLNTVDLANMPFVQISLAVTDQIDNKYTVRRGKQHQFSEQESTSGFTSFMPLTELYNPQRGYIVGDTCIIEVEIAACKPVRKTKYSPSKEVQHHMPIPENNASGSLQVQRSALAGNSVGAEQPSRPPIDFTAPVAVLVPEPKAQTDLEIEINKPVEVVKGPEPVRLAKQLSVSLTQSLFQSPVDSTPPTQTGPSVQILGLNKHPLAGQLFEERRNPQGFLDGKFEVIGGFSVLKMQASLYKQIWLKYGHIATNKILSASYITQVAAVTDIMKHIMQMHQCRLINVSSARINTWEKTINMAEKLEFNIKWLRDRLEEVKNGFYGDLKLKTKLQEQEESSSAANTSLQGEMNRMQANVYRPKSNSLVLDGLF